MTASKRCARTPVNSSVLGCSICRFLRRCPPAPNGSPPTGGGAVNKPSITMEHAESGWGGLETQLGPTRRDTVVDLPAQQCRGRELLEVAVRLAGVDQRLR